VGKKCIQNESAKDIKLSDVAWPSFILDLPRGDNRSLVDDQETSPVLDLQLTRGLLQ